MKCLVTGGAGFIGSHICDRLLALGHDVIAMDSEITGSVTNIAHLQNTKNFRYVKHDCTQPMPTDITAEVIFHFASPASPPKYQQYPIETLLVNTVGTYLLLEKARLWSAHFIYASTSEVYGDPLIHPQPETYWGNVNPNGPRSCYDESKRAGEAFVMSFVRHHHIKAHIIRIFNAYGPRMDIDDGRVVTNFIKQALAQAPLTINGDGAQTRSFCYVTDLVDGITRLLTREVPSGEVINLGNPQEKTILEFANVIGELMHYDGKYVFQKLPEDDPQRRQPDITKAKHLLDWEPMTSLADGLAKTIAYFREKKI